MKNLSICFAAFLFFSSIVFSQKWTTYNNNNTNSSLPSVNSLAADASGNIWIGSYKSLVKFDQGTKWTLYNNTNIPFSLDSDVLDVAISSSGTIWGCTYSNGLFSFNGASTWQQFIPSNSGILSIYTYCVTFDNPGNIWAGIFTANQMNAGLMKRDSGNNWTPYTFLIANNYRNVESIAKDNSGNIWCGTIAGVQKFDGTNWTTYTKENTGGGLGGNWVRAIAPDAAGNIWFGTMDLVNNSWVGTGLTKYDPTTNSWSNYIANSQDPTSKIVSSIAHRGNEIWVGTGFCGQYNGHGLYKFNGSTWTNFYNDNNTFPGTCINDLLVDKNNNLWIASAWGLTKVDFNPTGVKKEVVPSSFELSQNYPNPFNPETTINYNIPAAGYVSLKVYDLLGNEVATLVNEYQQAGTYNSSFYALRSSLTSGVYFYRLVCGSFIDVKKMLLMK
jgi:ligand-binding sensor domain-containing protein